MNPKVQAVIDGKAAFSFVPLDVGNGIQVRVFRDALKIDGKRLRVTARESQQIAYVTNCVLPSAVIIDRIYARSQELGFRIDPVTYPMAFWEQNKELGNQKVDASIDANIEGFPEREPIPNVGKHWVLDAISTKNQLATNYGWHVPGANFRGIDTERPVSLRNRVIQGLGRRHGIDHVDYSQICQLVHRVCSLEGQEIDFAELINTEAWKTLCKSNVRCSSYAFVEEILGIHVSPSS